MSTKVLLLILLSTVGNNELWASSLAGKLKHRLTTLNASINDQFGDLDRSNPSAKVNFSVIKESFNSGTATLQNQSRLKGPVRLGRAYNNNKDVINKLLSTFLPEFNNSFNGLNGYTRLLEDSINSTATLDFVIQSLTRCFSNGCTATIQTLSDSLLSLHNTQFTGLSGYTPLNRLDVSSTATLSGALSSLNTQFSSGCSAFSNALTSSSSSLLSTIPGTVINALSASLLSSFNTQFTGLSGYTPLSQLDNSSTATVAGSIDSLNTAFNSGFIAFYSSFISVAPQSLCQPNWQFYSFSPSLAGASLNGFLTALNNQLSLSYTLGNSTSSLYYTLPNPGQLSPGAIVSFSDNNTPPNQISFQYTGSSNFNTSTLASAIFGSSTLTGVKLGSIQNFSQISSSINNYLFNSLLGPMNAHFAGFPGYQFLTSLPSDIPSVVSTLQNQLKAGLVGAIQVLGPDVFSIVNSNNSSFGQALTYYAALGVYKKDFIALPGATGISGLGLMTFSSISSSLSGISASAYIGQNSNATEGGGFQNEDVKNYIITLSPQPSVNYYLFYNFPSFWDEDLGTRNPGTTLRLNPGDGVSLSGRQGYVAFIYAGVQRIKRHETLGNFCGGPNQFVSAPMPLFYNCIWPQ